MSPGDAPGILRAEKLEMRHGHAVRAASVLAHGARASQPRQWLEFGIALCELYRATPRSAAYRRGLRFIARAVAATPRDASAVAALAAAWRPLDPVASRTLFHTAFSLDPADPQILASVIELEAGRRGAALPLQALRPKIRAALQRGERLAGSGAQLARRHFEWATLQALANHPDAALLAGARGVAASPGIVPIASALEATRRLQRAVTSQAPHLEWLRQLLTLALAVRARRKPRLRQRGERERATTADRQAARRTAQGAARALRAMRPARRTALRGPILIVTGSKGAATTRQLQAPPQLLASALQDFRGTVIADGSSTRTEALQLWNDVVGAGIAPDTVKVIDFARDAESAVHAHIASALGARVAWVQRGAGDAAPQRAEADGPGGTGPVQLPADRCAIWWFVAAPPPRVAAPWREQLGWVLHAAEDGPRLPGRAHAAPGRAPLAWEDRAANATRADQIAVLLRWAGFELVPSTDEAVTPASFSAAEIDALAEMEHGRWIVDQVVPRLVAGRTQNLPRPEPAHHVAWHLLPARGRDLRRRFIRDLPRVLAASGFHLRRTRVAVPAGAASTHRPPLS